MEEAGIDGLVGIFAGKPKRQQEYSEVHIKDFHAEIGQS